MTKWPLFKLWSTAKVAILTLFRDEHICSLAFEKSLQISKVIWVRCALFLSEKLSRVYIWEKCQQKTKEDETIQIKLLGSSPFIKTSPAWKTKKTRWAGITVNYEMGAKLFKTETLCQKFKSIELNKIHLYFTMFQKFRWTNKFRGKTRPFNVLE